MKFKDSPADSVHDRGFGKTSSAKIEVSGLICLGFEDIGLIGEELGKPKEKF